VRNIYFLILFLLFGLYPKTVFCFQWPFKDTDGHTPIELEFHSVPHLMRQEAGGPRDLSTNDPRFHRGIDLVPLYGVDNKVYAINTGIVTEIRDYPDGNIEEYNNGLIIGTMNYYHVQVRTANINLFQSVTMGTYIGKMGSPMKNPVKANA
jgi:murein DD-endopeptidase MepM/ murein hydrolase activator NlpD